MAEAEGHRDWQSNAGQMKDNPTSLELDMQSPLPQIQKKFKFADTAQAPRISNMSSIVLPPVAQSQLGFSKTLPPIRPTVEAHTTCNWKDNDDISSWFKKKEKIDRERRSKPVRTAMKDANWILIRREKQMKEIQRRQKQEKAMMKEEERNPRRPGMNKAMSKKNRSSSNVEQQAAQEPKKERSPGDIFQVAGKHVGTMANALAGMGHMMTTETKFPRIFRNGSLEWQKPPKIKAVNVISRDRDTAVWIMPGVFQTKIVSH